MKSERRHELATNELADWVVHFPQWFRENMTTIAVTAVVAVGLILYTIYFYSRQGIAVKQKESIATIMLEQLAWQKETVLYGKVQDAGISDVFLNTAGTLGDIAAETENPALSALAMIKRAEALRVELHYRPTVADPDVRKYQLEQARKFCEQAMEKAKGEPVITAMAEYEMALCLEDAGDFGEAEMLYNKIAASTEYQGCSFKERAEFRLKILKDSKEKVFFTQVQRPEQMPNIQPVGPLTLEAPLTVEDMAVQKDMEFNSVQ